MTEFGGQLVIAVVAGCSALAGVVVSAAVTVFVESRRRRWERGQQRRVDLRALYGQALHAGRELVSAVEDLRASRLRNEQPTAEQVAGYNLARRRHGSLIEEIAIVGSEAVLVKAGEVHQVLGAVHAAGSATLIPDSETPRRELIERMRAELADGIPA